MILKNREIKDLNKLVLDKDYVVKDCQDQLGHLLEKDYNDVRVSVYRNNFRHIVQSLRLNISHVFSACYSVSNIKEYLISSCLHVSQKTMPLLSLVCSLFFFVVRCVNQRVRWSTPPWWWWRAWGTWQCFRILGSGCEINLSQLRSNLKHYNECCS